MTISSIWSMVSKPIFVRRNGGLRDLKQLAGQRVGTNEWPATGNVWSRALLREQKVAIDGMRWYVGPVDNPNAPRYSDNLPPYVQPIAADRRGRRTAMASISTRSSGRTRRLTTTSVFGG